MRKRKLAKLLLVCMAITTLFGGCTSKKEVYEYRIELGTEYTFNAAEIFNISANIAKYYEADLSTLDTNKVGTYDVEVKDTAEDKEYIVRYTVADTAAPELTVNKAYVVTNDINAINLAEIVTYTDAADCSEALTRFSKLADLKVMTDEEIKAYADALVFDTPQNLMAREDVSADGDGVYSAVYVVTDASGNINARELIVVLDTIAPEITGTDDMDESVTVKSYDDIATNNLVEQLTITDNLDGTITKSKVVTEVVEKDASNHVYTVTAEYTDRAGNTVEVSYDVKAVLSETQSAETEKADTDTQKDTESEDNKTSAELTITEYTYTELNKTMYAKDKVNVRDLPSSDGHKMGQFTKGTEVTVTGRCNETGWYRVKFGSFDYYVSDKYLTDEKVEKEQEKSQYSYEDRDGDGNADLADYTEMGGMLVWTKDISPEYAYFKKELSEAGMYVVKEYRGYYFVLAPSDEEALEFMKNWLWEHGMQFTQGQYIHWTKDDSVRGLQAEARPIEEYYACDYEDYEYYKANGIIDSDMTFLEYLKEENIID